MTIILFEDNLMWSARLMQSVKGLGHEGSVVSQVPDEAADVAIVNLSSERFRSLVPDLREKGIYVIGHAGHKEKELLQFGKEVGCDFLATNSQLTFKLPELLTSAKTG